jgi:large subunit ribosomal protein L17
MPASTQGWGRGFRKLGRKMSHRRQLLNSQVTSLITHDRIVTTVAKAKELRRYADWMVTYAKKVDKRDARREAGKYVKDQEALEKLITVLAPRFVLDTLFWSNFKVIRFDVMCCDLA